MWLADFALFVLAAQAASSVNFPSVYNDMALFTAHCITKAIKEGVKVMEISREAEEEWVKEIMSSTLENKQFRTECTPGYYNAEGNWDKIKSASRSGNYGKGPIAYREKIQEYVAKGTLEGFNLTM